MVIVKQIGLLIALAAVTIAHAQHSVIPQTERITEPAIDGPQETTGVTSIEILGFVPLDQDFPGMENRILRLRRIVLAPGGTVAVHRHDARPGIAHVLDGELTEYREDGQTIRRPGDSALESTGVTHGWRNHGDRPAIVIMTDITSEED